MQEEKEKMTRISATIPEGVAEQFKELCKKQRRSVSAQITLLMEQALREENCFPPSATPGGKPMADFIPAPLPKPPASVQPRLPANLTPPELPSNGIPMEEWLSEDLRPSPVDPGDQQRKE